MIFVNPVSGAISFVPVLTASDVGALASVPVSRTVFVDVNGNNTTGVASDLSKPVLTISRAITLATALTPTAANPVVIQVGPGTFIENSGITLPAYVSLVGAGRTATILQSSLSSTGNCAAIVNPGDYSVIAFLKIQATGIGSGLFAFPLGTGNPGTGFTGVILRGLDIVGDTDAIYIRIGVSADLIAFDCILRSKWDSTYIPSGSSADFYNCQSLVIGQAASSSVAPTHGLNTGGGIVRWFGGVIQAQGSTAPGIANIALSATSSGVLEVYNAKIVRPTATASWDFQATSGGSITYSGLARSDGAALTVSSFNSGTLTELSRYAVRDNNLSDLVSAATARTNLQISDAGNVKVYRALVSQAGGGAPTATVLENTLGGTVTWARVAAGIYTGSLTGAFTSAKTWCASPGGGDAAAGGQQALNLVRNDANSVFLVTNAFVSGAWTTTDDVLSSRPAAIEIRVYP